MASAGKIEIEVSAPYPCWCVVRVEGVEVARLHHRDLADLEYVAQRARVEAKIALPEKDHFEV